MARSRHASILIQPSPGLESPSSSSISSRELVAKRIRFAPLPEPDREEQSDKPAATPQISKHAAEGSDPDPPSEDLLASSSSSSSSSQSISSTPLIEKSSPDSSVGSSPVVVLSSLPKSLSLSIPDYIASPVSPSSSELSDVKKPHPFLRPFKRFYTSNSASSSNTITPTPSIDSHTSGHRKSITRDEILTLGVVNLFRTNSRESSHSATSLNRWGSGLTRWSSIGSTISLPSGSAPLSRTHSNQSYKSKSTSRFPAFSSSSTSLPSKPKSKPTPVGQQPRNRHKGAVMLNGRVYGKKNANPFANIPDQEPEFVEWGYGGMGSVKGAKSAGVSSDWGKLHGGSAMSDDGSRKVGVDADADADLDDGSGSAWVKRRRLERERKAREQKEKEAENDISESQTNTPTRSSTLETISGIPAMSLPPSAIDITTTQALTIDVLPLANVPEEGETATKSNFPTPTLRSELGGNSKPEGETSQLHNTHVLQAINVPIRSPRLHSRPSLRGTRELSVSVERPDVVPQIQVAGSPILVSPSGDDDTTDASTGVLHSSTMDSIETNKPSFASSSSSSGSESGSEVDEDDDDDGDDEEDDDEEDDEGQQSPLSNAALVEKIRRHKE